MHSISFYPYENFLSDDCQWYVLAKGKIENDDVTIIKALNIKTGNAYTRITCDGENQVTIELWRQDRGKAWKP